MKQLISIVIFSFFTSINIYSQHSEFGFFVGFSNYHGDLTPKNMEVSSYAPSFGAFGRYNFNGHIAAKVHFYKGILQGSDYKSQITKGERARNLSFKTDIYELGAQLEYNFLDFKLKINHHITTPYIFAGVAGFYYNPQAEINGQWFDLQPLATEGQGLEGSNIEPYQQTSIAIPMGFGIKFNINHLANIGLEFGMRKTFTDYIDDVSTTYPDLNILAMEHGDFAAALSYRVPEYNPSALSNPKGTNRGDPTNNDWYFFGGVTISVNIGNASEFK
ncbi:DUF6089 family protein [Saprospiraceae bacterium]|nr:DUF6089 family protein [Saprospiraceae bacterium]MDG1435554.1 DUF6089 family protein [Saprospiraceae bacterium]